MQPKPKPAYFYIYLSHNYRIFVLNNRSEYSVTSSLKYYHENCADFYFIFPASTERSELDDAIEKT